MKQDKETLLKIYRDMLAIRKFEYAARELYANGLLLGGAHLYAGEEAIATGVCSVLNDDDFITSTHRGHGHLIAKGGDLNLMMAELAGKATGYCKGKGDVYKRQEFCKTGRLLREGKEELRYGRDRTFGIFRCEKQPHGRTCRARNQNGKRAKARCDHCSWRRKRHG